jgi:glycosyltransferase involved in cell wall biosynthesis
VTNKSTRGRLLVINWQDTANPLAGGAEVHLLENLTRLVRDGFEITLLCSNFEGGEPDLEYEGIRIMRRGGRFDFNLRVPTLVRSLVHKEKYDLLIEDINKIPFYTPLYQPVPVLAVVPHLFATTVFQEINFLLASYIFVCEYPVRWAYRGVPFCVISESTRDDLVERGFPESSIEVIHCGIDHQVYHVDPRGAKFAQPTILYLGRLKKYKSVQHLIEAFEDVMQRMPEARLVIIGDGDYRQALEALARKRGVGEHVTFTGFIAAEDKVRYLQRAWVAVCPSLKEGWGLTNIEANACGTVVVAADVPGLRDSVSHGTNGFLYPYGDTGALAEQLHTLLTEPSVRTQLESGAIEWARQFDWNLGARRWGELIDRIIAGSRGPS